MYICIYVGIVYVYKFERNCLETPKGPIPHKVGSDKILHDPKDSKLWELWYIPYNG